MSGYSGVLDLATAGLSECDSGDLKGGSIGENVAILFAFANNKGAEMKRGLRDSIYLNAAAGLLSVCKVSNLQEGVHLARKIVEEGQLSEWLNRVKAFYSDIQ